MTIRIWLSLGVLALFLPGAAHPATMALVGEEAGHAILVEHNGNCYAVMPDHVATSDRMPLVSALPQITGMASVFHRRSELDLAVAYVEGDLALSCRQPWNALAKDVSTAISDAATGGLSRIQFGGQFIDRAEGAIVDADDTHFIIVTSERWSSPEIMAGVSGALFSVGAQPVGIALTAKDTKQARFLRMDRIYEALSGVLNTNKASHPSRINIEGAGQGIAYNITSQVRVLNGTRRGIHQAFDNTWDGADLEIEFTLSNTEPIQLNQITLETTLQGDKITFPQRVALQLDRGGPGQPFWVDIFSPDMPPSGRLEVSTGQTFARRVRLTIQSVWHPDRQMRLDKVTFQ